MQMMVCLGQGIGPIFSHGQYTTEVAWGCFWLQMQAEGRLKNQKPESSSMCFWGSNAPAQHSKLSLRTCTLRNCNFLRCGDRRWIQRES